MKVKRFEVGVIGLIALGLGALLAIPMFGPVRSTDRTEANIARIDPAEDRSDSIGDRPRAERSEPKGEKATQPPGPAPEGMVWIPGGTFWMGADDASMPDATPVHEVTVSGFWMDRTEVTNRQFARFVRRDRLRHGRRA